MKKWFEFLLSPCCLGWLLTALFAVSVFYYYQERLHPSEISGMSKLIYDIDQKSIDYRLLLRGPKTSHPRVAVLAVDDRSIEKWGRWPWSRDKIAKALEKAYQLEVSLIASDIVWSEPTARPEVELTQKLLEKQPTLSRYTEDINNLLQEFDADQALSQFIERHKERFILGHYFESPFRSNNNPMPAHHTPCVNAIFKTTLLNTISEKQSRPLIVTDDRYIFWPQELDELYATALADMNLQKKLEFCRASFLNPEKDPVAESLQENWADIQQELFKEERYSSFHEWVSSMKNRALLNAVPETYFWNLNINSITQRGALHGYFNATQDRDGTIRRSQLLTRSGSYYFPSIALLAYLADSQQTAEISIRPLPKSSTLKGIEKLVLNNDEGEPRGILPVDHESFVLINYLGPKYSIPHYSIADLLDESTSTVLVTQREKDSRQQWITTTKKVPQSEAFKNKIFILGVTAMAVYDLRVTPFDENFPGVETHANILDNLLTQNFLKHHKDEDLYMSGTLLALGFLLTAGISYSGALLGLLLTLFSMLLCVIIDQRFLFSNGIVVSIVFPIFLTLFIYITLTFYKYLTEEKSKKALRQTFSKYVSPQIVEEILKDPKNIELGGKKVDVTVFFSDVRSFTTLSEKLDPKEISDLLNFYLTPMSEIIFQKNGTLDKYMGDAIMAFFGAPIPFAKHAHAACQASLAQMSALRELNKQLVAKNLPELDIGIGLNSGECSVGNMGSQTIRNYTVMGDHVNLASRLEGINKEYGTHIIISEMTYERVKNDFSCREIDWVKVKGKTKPIRIYELFGDLSIDESDKKALEIFSQGYSFYHKKQFETALSKFEDVLRIRPHDGPALTYIERCKEFLAHPPDENWDGVFEMKTK